MWVLVSVLVLIIWHSRKVNKLFYNPYKLILYAGEKGQGKTLKLAEIANKHDKVYSNFGIGEALNQEYWKYDYPENSALFIDEIGLKHNNRNFKSFPEGAVEFFKYQRKKKLYIYLSSQTMDFDKKIRDMLDYMVIVKRLPNPFSWVYYGMKYKHNFQVVELESGGSMVQDVEKRSGLQFIGTIPNSIRKGLEYDTNKEIDK